MFASTPSSDATPFAPAVIERLDADAGGRCEAEAFVGRIFLERHGARVRSFLPHLFACRDAQGRLQAVVGVRLGSEGPLFVEQYLDMPVEHQIARHLGRPVQRSQIAEVGNFAALHSGSARDVIPRMTRELHAAGVRWVVFSATRQLRNAFRRLGLAPTDLAEARADRLRDDASDWGSYYATHPKVMLGDVAAGRAILAAREGGGRAHRQLPCASSACEAAP